MLLKLQAKEVQKFILIFYTVGVLGFVIPFTRELFITITPLALIVCIGLLANFHQPYSQKSIFIYSLIFILGFSIEAIGVKTGVIFGEYTYGSGLGIKILHTPLLIGINWLFLVYCATSIVNSFTSKNYLIVIVAPALMLVYDLVMEQVAPEMDMWHWNNNHVPFRNYLAWYLIAFVFVSIFQIFKIDTTNPLARILFVCQFVFFTILMFLLR